MALKNKKTILVHTLITVVAGLSFMACNADGALFHAYCSLPATGWSKQDTLLFQVDVKDSLTTYQLHIESRNSQDYPYQNLPLYLACDPQESLAFDTLNLMLITPKLGWERDGWETLHSVSFHAGEMRIRQAGTYTIKIAHHLPDSIVQGIRDIGIKICKP